MCEMTADKLRSILDYDPSTGEFRWRAGYARCVRAGRVAGRVDGRGYASISLGGRQRAAHRLAWLHVYGENPPLGFYVEHINGVKNDNRMANLRLATPQENARNRKKHGELPKGVALHKCGKWQAQISPNGVPVYLGLFGSPEDAHKAYAEAAARLYGDFARAK